MEGKTFGSESRQKRPRRVPRPDRPRRISEARAFGWIDAQLFREGWLPYLRLEEIAVYAFLCLAADREGVSFYRVASIERKLGVDHGAILEARDRLVSFGLVAFEPYGPGQLDGYWQVLPVPVCPMAREMNARG